MPLICYQTKRFNKSSLEIIETAARIIDDYAEQGLSLTLRQLYYRFVAAAAIPNTEKSYKRIGSIINDARLAGLLDWEAIEDRGRELISPSSWSSPQSVLRSAARSFALDHWKDQRYRVEVWVEKQALEGVIGQAADARRVPYFACKGYTSQSEMWRAAMRMRGYIENGQQPVIIHLGDHDPSGIDMTRDIADRLNKVFDLQEVSLSGCIVERIALNWSQIEEYEPPPNPAKMTDSRFAQYEAQYGDESWELDALEPATLNEMIIDAIDQYLDRDLYDATTAREQQICNVLELNAENWEGVQAWLLSHKDKTPPKKKGGRR
jgi:hypothetical protein